ncbi:MAG: aminotransferase class V-fold PLP-dependent enzyme [Thiotrichales bacterium]
MNYADEFSLDRGLIHLNHAGVSPWPRRVVAAIATFASENARVSSLDYASWLVAEQGLRERLRRLINAGSSDSIALLKNTSEGLSTVAFGLPWRRGDSVVGIAQEFPSNRAVWAALEPRYGVQFRAVDIAGRDDPEAALFDAVDHSTRLIAVSAVQYATGLRMDLERIGAFCNRRGILFCVDAIQHLGALPFDVEAFQADFVAADGHKWLLAPEGVALFYCRETQLERLTLNQYGWHMQQRVRDFEATLNPPAADARRFEAGSPNNLGIRALSASLDLLLEIGMERVAAAIAERVAQIAEEVARRDWNWVTPNAPERRAGIATFSIAGVDHPGLFQKLIENRVLCAQRAGGIRFSPHFHTSKDAAARAFQVIDALVSRP